MAFHENINLKPTDLSAHKRNTVILTVVIAFLVIVLATLSTLAYLTDIFNDTENINVGAIEVGLYNNSGNTLISGYENTEGQYLLGAPILVTLGGTLSQPTSVDLWLKNTGTIAGISRVFLAINFAPEVEDDNQGVLLTELQATLNNTGWVNQFLYSETVGQRSYYLEAYYNAKVQPNTPVRVITSITPILAEALTADLEITVRADMVAYSGNAYQLEDAGQTVPVGDKPFGNLSGSFLSTWTAWE